MKQKLIKFLELEEKATPGPWDITEDSTSSFFSKNWRSIPGVIGVGSYTSSRDGEVCGVVINEINAQFIAQSRTIAPLAVNKLIEAVELLQETVSIQPDAMKISDLVGEINKFLEDFNND